MCHREGQRSARVGGGHTHVPLACWCVSAPRVCCSVLVWQNHRGWGGIYLGVCVAGEGHRLDGRVFSLSTNRASF